MTKQELLNEVQNCWIPIPPNGIPRIYTLLKDRQFLIFKKKEFINKFAKKTSSLIGEAVQINNSEIFFEKLIPWLKENLDVTLSIIEEIFQDGIIIKELGTYEILKGIIE